MEYLVISLQLGQFCLVLADGSLKVMNILEELPFRLFLVKRKTNCVDSLGGIHLSFRQVLGSLSCCVFEIEGHGLAELLCLCLFCEYLRLEGLPRWEYWMLNLLQFHGIASNQTWRDLDFGSKFWISLFSDVLHVMGK